jgi:hypothetical protein
MRKLSLLPPAPVCALATLRHRQHRQQGWHGMLFWLLALTFQLHSFAATQHVRGTVRSQVSARPLGGCLVQLRGARQYETLTDSAGRYDLLVETGKYQVIVFKQGFTLLRAGEVQVLSAKQYVVDAQLQESNHQVDTVEVNYDNAQGAIAIEIWDTQRLPASFYDPARAATAWAGLVNTDDQANNISVYGASPNFIQWRLEGVEIVNPNHLENSGTLNDRPSTTGGGVCLLSAQLLQGSSFHYPPFKTGMGNALGGIFDMKFRTGNNERSERTAQVGLLGTDISFEGPFSKQKPASYLVNYRYSTVGLLTQLGVDFGEERINYQDLSLLANIPTRRGQLRFFGAGGISTNDYAGQKDTALVEMQKQLQDIRYRSATGIGGVSYLFSVGNNAYVKMVAAYSAKQVTRASDVLVSWPGIVSSDESYRQDKLSAVAFVSRRFASRVVLKGGSQVNYFTNESRLLAPFLQEKRISDPVLQPFASAEQLVFGRAELAAGLHVYVQPRLSFVDLQPRAELKYRFSEAHRLVLFAGRSAQLHNPLLYLQPIGGERLTPAITNAAALSYHARLGRFAVAPRVFYQYYTNLAANDSFYFSSFNYLNEQVAFSLSNSGKARAYGIEVTSQASVNGWYLQASAAAFNSEYCTRAEVYRESRFNAKINTALNLGREMKLRDERRTLGVYLKYMWRDGFLESLPESPYLYSERLPAYYRIDARLSLQTDKTKITSLLALDIQNLTNRKNVAYHYDDVFTGQREIRYQLGIVPVISYKIFF